MSDFRVTQDTINAIIDASKISITKIDPKTTVVIATLQNGFVILESSSCVDPDNYDENIGRDLCMEKIKEKLWELEGYRLQCKIHENKIIPFKKGT